MTATNEGSTNPGTALVEPLEGDALAEVEDLLDMARNIGGYVPTSLRIMARKPAILRAFSELRNAVMRAPGDVSQDLKWLAVHAASTSAGCLYCQAHTAANGNKNGIPIEKIESLLSFETSDLYSDAERAVIDLGLAVGQVPNATEPRHFAALREHFSDEGIVEIVAALSLFGWLNRWNDTFSSDLEEAPLAFARSHLSARGWSAGKHSST